MSFFLFAADSAFICREETPVCVNEEVIRGSSSSLSLGALIGELKSETLAMACVPNDGVDVTVAGALGESTKGALGVSTKSMNLLVEHRSYREFATSEMFATSGVGTSAFLLGTVGLGVAVATLHNKDAMKSSSLADTFCRLKFSETPSTDRGMLTSGTGMTCKCASIKLEKGIAILHLN
jgi:hypothetical protein